MKHTLCLITAVATLAACSGESGFPDPTGEGSVRAINAIKTSPDIAFLIEERSLGAVGYKTASAVANYDDFSYRFNFEVGLPGDTEPTRVAGRDLQVVADTEYTFVVSGQLSSPTITLWETAEREFSEGATVFEARFAHTADSLGPVDIYFAAPGVAPVVGEQRATAAFGEVSAAQDFEAGDYVMTVTAAGDPSVVHFESDTISPVGSTALLFSVFDGDANELAPYAVRAFGSDGSAISVAAAGIQPQIRFFHAASNLEPSDIYTDEDVTNLLIEDHAFRDVTTDRVVPTGLLNLTYTAANNVGAIQFEQDFSPLPNVRSNFFVINSGEGFAASFSNPDRRSVETLAKFSFINTASDQELSDLYLVDADVLIDDRVPTFFSLLPNAVTIGAPLNPGSYDLYMTVANEKTIVAGPLRLDVALGDVIEVIAYDNPSDPTMADLVIIPAP